MKYEYYSQYMTPGESSQYKQQLDVMGALGWELVSIINDPGPTGPRHLHTFKRIPPDESKESTKVTTPGIQPDQRNGKYGVRRKRGHRRKRVNTKLHKSRLPKAKKRVSRKDTKKVAPLCQQHPLYQAIRMPRVNCKTCKRAYIKLHPIRKEQ